MYSKCFLCALCVLGGFSSAFGISVTPQTNTSNTKSGKIGLDEALSQLNAVGGTLTFPSTDGKFDIYLIDTDNDNTLTQVRAVNSSGSFNYLDFTLVIDGKGGSLFGDRSPPGQKSAKGNPVRGFFVGGNLNGMTPTSGVTINNVFFTGCGAVGGTGGGGGMGAGGGLYVGEGTKVFINDCTFRECMAQGGVGTNKENTGGGGMKGNGSGPSNDNASGSSGGGFGGDAGSDGGGGCSDFKVGNSTSARPGGNFNGDRSPFGGDGIGGASGQVDPNESNGGHGGGGARNIKLNESKGGGDGRGGYGGGGARLTTALKPSEGRGSSGGFGGGGGSGKKDRGGAGGFGGGGGLDDSSTSKGGFGGGDGTTTSAGNGAAFGGAIFMEPNAELTIGGSFMLKSNSAMQPMGGGNPGLAMGQDIFMMSTSLLTINTTNDVCLFNPIEGDQGDRTPLLVTTGLIKQGTNLLLLTGDNTYTGRTIVEGGTLEANGSLVSRVEVISGATLQGKFDLKVDNTGTNGGELNNEGTFKVSPQTKIESLYLNNGGSFNTDITPTGNLADKTFVIGNAQILSGPLQIFVGQGNYISGTTYTLIDGNVDGTFDGNNMPNLSGPGASSVLVDVSTGSLILTVLNENIFVQFPDPLIPGGVPIPIIFSSNTANQLVRCFRQSNHPPESDLALVIESLGSLSIPEQNKVLPTLSARQYGSLEWINARNNSYVADLLTQHLSSLYWDCNCCFSGWVTGFGNLMQNQRTLDNLPRYNADSAGFLVGVDYCLSSCLLYGAAFGYTRTDVLWRNDRGGGNTDSYYGALYADYELDCFGIDFSILGGGTNNNMKRHIVFGSVDRNARSDYWSYFFTAHLGVEPFRWTTCTNSYQMHFEPFALADYHYYTHETFTEKGASSLNLRIKSKNQHLMRSEVGLKWRLEKCCECYILSPYVGISWVGEFPLNKSKQPASFKNENCVIDALSYDSSVHLGAPQAGIRWSHCNGTSLLLGYKGLYNGSVRINEVEGRFEYVF